MGRSRRYCTSRYFSTSGGRLLKHAAALADGVVPAPAVPDRRGIDCPRRVEAVAGMQQADDVLVVA